MGSSFDLTFTLLSRPSGILTPSLEKYAPMVSMWVFRVDIFVLQYTISYPKLGSPLLSKCICVLFTVKFTFLISMRSCGDKYEQDYIAATILQWTCW